MYTEHFGLKQRPFGSNATGERVFVGPQQVKIISSLGNALSGNDAIVTLSGRVGVGKTTVVNRALESVASQRAVARIGRIQLGPDEVLELLLTEFGVTDQPSGTIQRYSAFKNLLNDWARSNTRSFIVVEDAIHAGIDALLELEAMTAADAGDSPGACIVLMGTPELDEFLQSPKLDRLRQRLRRRSVLEPCSPSELKEYLDHCFRVAGRESAEILGPGTVEMLYRLSEGIPRVVGNICETAFIAAAGSKMQQLTPHFVETVAREVFGVTPGESQFEPAPPVPEPVVENSAESAPAPAVEKPAEPEPTPVAEKPAPEAPEEVAPEVEPEPELRDGNVEQAAQPPDQPETVQEEQAPELIDDTQRGVHQLVVESGFAPNVVHASDSSSAANSDAADEEDGSDEELPDYDDIPELIDDTRPALKELSLDEHVEGDTRPELKQLAVDDHVEGDTRPELKQLAVDEHVEGDTRPDLKKLALEDDVESEEPVQQAPVNIESTQTQRTLLISQSETEESTEQTPAEAKQAVDFDPRNHVPEFEDLPTLSNSMRVPIPDMQDQSQPADPEESPAVDQPAEIQAQPEQPVEVTAEKPASPTPVSASPAVSVPEESKPDADFHAALEIDHALLEQFEPGSVAKPESEADKVDAESAADSEVDAISMVLANEQPPEGLTLEAAIAATSVPSKPNASEVASDPVPVVELQIEGEGDAPTADASKASEGDMDMDKWAAELGKAESLEDINDVMAETLFGSVEMGEISAEIVQDAAVGRGEADNPGTIGQGEANNPGAMDLLDIPQASPEYPAAAQQPDTSGNGQAKKLPEPAGESATPAEAVSLGQDPAPEAKPSTGPIEDQIESEITASQRALDEKAIAELRADDDLDDEEQKGPGLFSGLFKRASKQ